MCSAGSPRRPRLRTEISWRRRASSIHSRPTSSCGSDRSRRRDPSGRGCEEPTRSRSASTTPRGVIRSEPCPRPIGPIRRSRSPILPDESLRAPTIGCRRGPGPISVWPKPSHASLADEAFPNEPAIARSVWEAAPSGSTVYAGSSMPIRDLDSFSGRPRGDRCGLVESRRQRHRRPPFCGRRRGGVRRSPRRGARRRSLGAPRRHGARRDRPIRSPGHDRRREQRRRRDLPLPPPSRRSCRPTDSRPCSARPTANRWPRLRRAFGIEARTVETERRTPLGRRDRTRPAPRRTQNRPAREREGPRKAQRGRDRRARVK